MAKKKETVKVETIIHRTSKRKNIPPAEAESLVEPAVERPVELRYPRNPDLDPQLVWKGKDAQNDSDLVVNAPTIYIQEKIHPKSLVDDLQARAQQEETEVQYSLFDDFNGIPKDVDKTEFYQHDQHWTNRMILGDSLLVMASLAEREGLRGKVQCIYMDPPYGIKFNSNFQWSTTSTQVKDGKIDNITREPEQVKAFRDTWRNGVNSYLSYLRDRFVIARDLLADSGSIFVQIGDENVHRVRAVLDEVFGEDNFESQIAFATTTGRGGDELSKALNYILWYAKDAQKRKFRKLFRMREFGGEGSAAYNRIETPDGHRYSLGDFEKIFHIEFDYNRRSDVTSNCRLLTLADVTSANHGQGVGETGFSTFTFQGQSFKPGSGTRAFTTHEIGMNRLAKSNRLEKMEKMLRFVRYFDDFLAYPLNNNWDVQASVPLKTYIVQTATKIIQRCILMTTDPGDLVLDPTCGSGTTAYVAEQWGRRWITIDTSRVSLALARARLMGAAYPYYLLADTVEGQQKIGEMSHRAPSTQPVHGDIKQGFVYQRIPHITLKSIANNVEIDVIWEQYQPALEELRKQINQAAGKQWEEWELPRESDAPAVNDLLKQYWELRIKRQKEIDASIAAKAEFENLYDKPVEDKKRVRVSGPFTVESLSPFRTMEVNADDSVRDPMERVAREFPSAGFEQMILKTALTSGIQQSDKKDKIVFTSLTPMLNKELLIAEGTYMVGDKIKRAGLLLGPEFGSVSRQDLVRAAKESGDMGHDVLISLAFNYEPQASTLDKFGRLPILRGRINADLHMAGDLKNTGSGNLFIIFGEPDIEIQSAPYNQIQVQLKGVDVYVPSSGEIRSDDPDGIACWFIDTNYNDESFFVRQAYFPGTTNDPYDKLKKTLKATVDPDVWQTLNTTLSVPFDKPSTGRIAVKVINHLGDEVLKVYDVE